jgi:hypothetical protein
VPSNDLEGQGGADPRGRCEDVQGQQQLIDAHPQSGSRMVPTLHVRDDDPRSARLLDPSTDEAVADVVRQICLMDARARSRYGSATTRAQNRSAPNAP